jgi:starch synthase
MPETATKEIYSAVHFAAECYPIAKVGGLGDVAGALPKYLNLANIKTCIFLPYYNQKWTKNNTTTVIFDGVLSTERYSKKFSIRSFSDEGLGYDLFFVDIPELLYREQVYGYEDDPLRFLFFQQAALSFIATWKKRPEILHCHDHHTGLIPFMINQCPIYNSLKGIRTVFTIHNGLYTGAFDWSLAKYLPNFYLERKGFLDWGNAINPLAAAIKCCDYYTTVSEGYLEELKQDSNPLNWLYNEYSGKSKGIVNGIDNEVWDPKTDETLATKFTVDWTVFKLENKKEICATTGLNPECPLVVFIGRLNVEKGGELLTQAIENYCAQHQNINFYILGSGANSIEDSIRRLTRNYKKNITNYIGYNETLAHQLYAAADFILMPSLVEPCGLNQLYAMRYATIPIVHSVGGLKDTVVDFGDKDGYGIRFNEAKLSDIQHSFNRAVKLYSDKALLEKIRKIGVSLDFSWKKAIKKYIEIYKNK